MAKTLSEHRSPRSAVARSPVANETGSSPSCTSTHCHRGRPGGTQRKRLLGAPYLLAVFSSSSLDQGAQAVEQTLEAELVCAPRVVGASLRFADAGLHPRRQRIAFGISVTSQLGSDRRPPFGL